MRSLVLIHGFTGSPSSFDALVERLSARCARLRVLRPALLGHGAAAPASISRFEQEVDRIAAAVSRARFGPSHLCGYSLGARVALGLLVRHPYLFAGATLIGVHPGLASLQERAARVGSDERWCNLLRTRGVGVFLEAWQAQPLFASQQRLAGEVADAQHRVRNAHAAEGLARALRVLGLGQMPDYRGSVPLLPVGLRLLVGAEDLKFAGLARTLGHASPRVELDLVPGVGHNVLLEAPERVESVLMRALAA